MVGEKNMTFFYKLAALIASYFRIISVFSTILQSSNCLSVINVDLSRMLKSLKNVKKVVIKYTKSTKYPQKVAEP